MRDDYDDPVTADCGLKDGDCNSEKLKILEGVDYVERGKHLSVYDQIFVHHVCIIKISHKILHRTL